MRSVISDEDKYEILTTVEGNWYHRNYKEFLKLSEFIKDLGYAGEKEDIIMDFYIHSHNKSFYNKAMLIKSLLNYMKNIIASESYKKKIKVLKFDVYAYNQYLPSVFGDMKFITYTDKKFISYMMAKKIKKNEYVSPILFGVKNEVFAGERVREHKISKICNHLSSLFFSMAYDDLSSDSIEYLTNLRTIGGDVPSVSIKVFYEIIDIIIKKEKEEVNG